MAQRISLVLILMIFWGCSKRISSKAVIGSWWSLQEDSTYFEVYINEEQFVFNHEKALAFLCALKKTPKVKLGLKFKTSLRYTKNNFSLFLCGKKFKVKAV
ncbi:MAG: hypothetical protein Q8S14_10880 [Algoriphagus sp.]|uniref:hypothetical protein n=1 Tax=Algoriphagus sp. TaxID=1872435 RepID=UPI0027253B6A|nr:hypothetical protein [Algoriphagus sp.]MDO8968329.1 hypothetical protein [Algoriphagus sp.]MDP2040827.1 hypothetical protein [Algoriphagus sp.]MDP3200124.1 hypothetical protein [Algoriphagus sp.]MDP3472366.1 hypothetical protein [Algoriphagus sp.]